MCPGAFTQTIATRQPSDCMPIQRIPPELHPSSPHSSLLVFSLPHLYLPTPKHPSSPHQIPYMVKNWWSVCKIEGQLVYPSDRQWQRRAVHDYIGSLAVTANEPKLAASSSFKLHSGAIYNVTESQANLTYYPVMIITSKTRRQNQTILVISPPYYYLIGCASLVTWLEWHVKRTYCINTRTISEKWLFRLWSMYI